MSVQLAGLLGISTLPRKTYSADGAISREPQIAVLNGADASAEMTLADPGEELIGKFLLIYASSVANTVNVDFTDRSADPRTVVFSRVNEPLLLFGLTADLWQVVIGPGETAITQTYSTADATHAARTAADLTEDGGAIGGTNDGDLPALTGTPSGTDAAIITALIASVREIAVMLNALRADQVDTAQVLNSVVDALQAQGALR